MLKVNLPSSLPLLLDKVFSMRRTKFSHVFLSSPLKADLFIQAPSQLTCLLTVRHREN